MARPSSTYTRVGGAITAGLLVAIGWFWSMQGQHAFVEQPIAWPTVYGNFPTIGDGSNARGGIPPLVAEGREPAVIPSNYPTGTGSPYLVAGTSFPGVGSEAKFRTTCSFAFNGQFDPILYPGRGDLGHMHTFFGNKAVTPSSNYASLRLTGDSTCAGGLLNRSAYWYPSILKDNATGDGRTKIKIPNFGTVYYVAPSQALAARMQRIPRGLGYVFGFNPADPNNNYVNDTFIGQSATGRFKPIDNNGGSAGSAGGDHGFKGWKCETSRGDLGANASPVSGYSGLQPWLRNADGTATLDCPTNENLMVELKGPACMDGVNLMSPNGRKHVFPGAVHIDSIGSAPFCPEGWYHIPYFELVLAFTHNGYLDYKEWYLSSDRMTDAAFIHADQPCHASNITNGVPGSFCNGQTMHTDWFGAWDEDTWKTWQRDCVGTSDESWGAGTYHECGGSQLGDGRVMNTNDFVDQSQRSEADSWVDLPQQP